MHFTPRAPPMAYAKEEMGEWCVASRALLNYLIDSHFAEALRAMGLFDGLPPLLLSWDDLLHALHEGLKTERTSRV